MLLIGPPGSGKTHFVLASLERAVRERRSAEVLLVVPTASMAQHLTHQLARKGCVVPAGLIQTLSDFVEGFTPDLKEPTAALELYLLRKAIEAAAAPEFAALEKSRGLEAKLASVIAEFHAAGCDASQAQPFLRTPYQGAFLRVFREYGNLLERHGFVHRNERLLRTAQKVREGGLAPLREVYFDAFYQFSHGEQQLIEAVHALAETVVTFPAGMPHPFGNMPERKLEAVHRPSVTPAIVSAASPQNETEEIARLILEEARPFRDFIVIVRSPDVSAPLIQATFERYGIPFRMRAPRPLAHHGVVRYLRGLLESAANGFPGEQCLDIVRSPYSPIGLHPQTDIFDFRVRERLPGAGLSFFAEPAGELPVVSEFLERLNGISTWAEETAPPEEWTERCRLLRREWVQLPVVGDGLTATEALEMRELAQALKQFDAAADEAAKIVALGAGESVALPEYLGMLDEVLRETPLRIADHRHDVVNVVSVFEARQWESPVAFVCGLVERQFPRHHAQDLFFPDADRVLFQKQGWLLRTSVQREEEERSLYAIATTRATEKLVLTYARRDERDQPLLRSFLLPPDYENDRASAAVRVREDPASFVQDKPRSLSDPVLLSQLLERHVRFSPSSLESYLQCPFQFFAQRTLRLQGRPDDPERRVDPMLTGTIIHRAIAVWSADRKRPIVEVLDEVFDETLQAKAVAGGFQTELLRYNLRSDLARFAQERMANPLGDPEGQKCETQIFYAIDDEEKLFINGRIDRYDVFGDNSGLVVDYKYSSDSRVKGIMDEHEQGAKLQAPLYLLGLQKQLGIRPAGMRFWGLRRKTTVMGWVAEGIFPKEHMLEGDRALSSSDLEAKLEAALEKARQAIDEIRGGLIAVEPRDERFCQMFCDFRDVCRVDS